MGWLFSTRWSTRKSLIAHLTETEDNQERTRTCLTHCLRGNILWSVWEVTRKQPNSNRPLGKVYRYIGCDKLQFGGKSEGWGYKDMDETVHPCYYTCPLKYLDMQPRIDCQEWRDEVIKQHNLRSMPIEPGILLGLKDGFIVKVILVVRKTSRSRFIGKTRDGREFGVDRKYLSGEAYATWPETA